MNDKGYLVELLRNKNIHFIECENWCNAYGYEKSQMKEDVINYIEQLQQENKQFKERLNKALRLIWENYGVLDKYGIELLEDTLKGDCK